VVVCQTSSFGSFGGIPLPKTPNPQVRRPECFRRHLDILRCLLRSQVILSLSIDLHLGCTAPIILYCPVLGHSWTKMDQIDVTLASLKLWVRGDLSFSSGSWNVTCEFESWQQLYFLMRNGETEKTGLSGKRNMSQVSWEKQKTMVLESLAAFCFPAPILKPRGSLDLKFQKAPICP
jgi:hypothetical protein